MAVFREPGSFRLVLQNVCQQAPHVAPATGTGRKAPAKSERRDKARTFAKKRDNVAREGSMKAEVLALVAGATEKGSAAGQHGCYAVPVLRGPAAFDEKRARRASAMTSAIESFQIFAAARVSAGSAWL